MHIDDFIVFQCRNGDPAFSKYRIPVCNAADQSFIFLQYSPHSINICVCGAACTDSLLGIQCVDNFPVAHIQADMTAVAIEDHIAGLRFLITDRISGMHQLGCCPRQTDAKVRIYGLRKP